MTTAWLPWATYDPAPIENAGYTFAYGVSIPKEVTPDQKMGDVVHSSEGYFTFVNPSAVMRARGNSWSVTVMRSGAVWKHRDRPTFVDWHAGGPAQNVPLVGMEVEGDKDDPWTAPQRESVLRVLVETWAWFGWTAFAVGSFTQKTQENIRQRITALGYGSAWEHRWLDYTSCPSGRNQWTYLNTNMQQALEEDDMTVGELAGTLDSMRRRLGRWKRETEPDPLSPEERALFDNLVGLMPLLMPAYIDKVLSVPGGRRGQIDAWERMIEHPEAASGGVTLEQVRQEIEGASLKAME